MFITQGWKQMCSKGGSRHKDSNTMEIEFSLKRHASSYSTLHRSDIAAWAAPLDPRLCRPSWIEDSLGFIERHESYGSVIKNGAANWDSKHMPTVV